MRTKKRSMRAAAMIGACALLSAIGACPAHGQDSPENAGDQFITPVPYTSGDLRDPFESYIVKDKNPLPVEMVPEDVVLPEMKVSGVTWGSSFPQAIVNDKVVKAGDMIGDVKVVSISKEELVFSYMDQQFIMAAPGIKGAMRAGKEAAQE